MLVDSHCHLDFDAFAEDFSDVLDRSRAAGVGAMVTICTRLSKFGEILAVAQAHDDIWCSVGVHPHEAADEAVVDPAPLVEAARHDKVVGIGETGLDYYYEHSPREAQQASFRVHIGAARMTGLPLIVHTRDADEDTMRILEAEHRNGAFQGVIHCFTASRTLAERALEIGFYISFSGIVTFKNANDIQETARIVPMERLLVETDSPYLAPVPNRGKRNEPAFVADTAAHLAALRGMSLEAFAEATTDNFYRLFSKARRPAAA